MSVFSTWIWGNQPNVNTHFIVSRLTKKKHWNRQGWVQLSYSIEWRPQGVFLSSPDPFGWKDAECCFCITFFLGHDSGKDTKRQITYLLYSNGGLLLFFWLDSSPENFFQESHFGLFCIQVLVLGLIENSSAVSLSPKILLACVIGNKHSSLEMGLRSCCTVLIREAENNAYFKEYKDILLTSWTEFLGAVDRNAIELRET